MHLDESADGPSHNGNVVLFDDNYCVFFLTYFSLCCSIQSFVQFSTLGIHAIKIILTWCMKPASTLCCKPLLRVVNVDQQLLSAFPRWEIGIKGSKVFGSFVSVISSLELCIFSTSLLKTHSSSQVSEAEEIFCCNRFITYLKTIFHKPPEVKRNLIYLGLHSS